MEKEELKNPENKTEKTRSPQENNSEENQADEEVKAEKTSRLTSVENGRIILFSTAFFGILRGTFYAVCALLV